MKLLAEFTIDSNGKPVSVSAAGHEHFAIALKVVDAPKGTRRVRYRLHPTYSESVRTVPARVPEFEEPITSYGDFEVIAEYEQDGELKQIKQKLSTALEDAHRESESSSIRAAIETIKRY